MTSSVPPHVPSGDPSAAPGNPPTPHGPTFGAEPGQTPEPFPSPPAVLARDLHRGHKSGGVKTRALDGVSIEFEQARWTAVMGPSGSGKSTLLHCLAGLDRPDRGSVQIGKKDITRMTEGGRTRDLRDLPRYLAPPACMPPRREETTRRAGLDRCPQT